MLDAARCSALIRVVIVVWVALGLGCAEPRPARRVTPKPPKVIDPQARESALEPYRAYREAVERKDEAAAIEDWTAGGMHAPTNPGVEEPPECGMFVTVKDGKWTRLYPEIGGEDDDGDGFHCPADSIVKVPDDQVPGEGAVDPDREI